MDSITTFFGNLTVGKKILLFLAPLITLLISMKAALLALSIFLLLDLITGIRKTLYIRGVKTNPLKKSFWLSIESYLLRKTWKKAYEYGIGIIVVILFRILLIGEVIIPFFSLSFSLIELSVIIPCLIEAWSIFENLEAVSGRNILKRIFSLLPEKIRVILTPLKTEKDV